MKRNKVFIAIMVWILVFVFLSSTEIYARIVRGSQADYTPEEITVRLLLSSKVWDSEFASVERYRGRMTVPDLIKQLEEIREKTTLSYEDLSFLIASLKYETVFFGWGAWGGRRRNFLTSVVLPREISVEDNVFQLLVDHLLWFNNYRLNDGLIGHELQRLQEEGEEQKAVFKGTVLGFVIDAIEEYEGILRTEYRHNVTGQFEVAAYWARPQNRVDLRYGSDEDKPTVELDRFNELMLPETQRRSDKYRPVVLAFKTSIIEPLLGVDLRRLYNYPEIRITGELSLNDLTYECKKLLVQSLEITEVKPWMDDEWRAIIQERFPD